MDSWMPWLVTALTPGAITAGAVAAPLAAYPLKPSETAAGCAPESAHGHRAAGSAHQLRVKGRFF